jgi:uncharacterized protein
MTADLSSLADVRYASVTTFKRDGTPVSRPVWVASDDGQRLLVWSGARTWRVRRIARDPKVFVARSDFKGRELGPRIAGSARVIDAGELGSLMLRRKYGWQKRALELQSAFMRRVLGRRPGAMVTIEIIPRH